MALDRSERLTAGLLAVFLVTIAVVSVVDTLFVWVVWSTAMIAVAGSALVLLNREKAAG